MSCGSRVFNGEMMKILYLFHFIWPKSIFYFKSFSMLDPFLFVGTILSEFLTYLKCEGAVPVTLPEWQNISYVSKMPKDLTKTGSTFIY